ncbi:hypothetical protein [Rhizorhabdus histidinilytica]|uniref:Uncharacterized protein n=1 Tax=Rhizorhabdus histidinilytica TaxID=439228 RepID=A0A1T5CH67_9SPHN|nr:hypothetical protein [Rhizorhabdus histidinilytica]SKB58696.1 hypothetical protein SAMN06295920_10455 [Rhizorhabdus histidinilytica]
MASTYYSVELGGSSSGRRYPVSGVGMGGRTIHSARGEYTISAALVVNDIIDMFDLPPNARVVGGFLKSDDLDTGGSPAIVLALGDAVDDDRFFTGATIGQAGGVTTVLAASGVDYVTTAKTRVKAKVTTGPATGATTGTIVGVLHYFVEEPK